MTFKLPRRLSVSLLLILTSAFLFLSCDEAEPVAIVKAKGTEAIQDITSAEETIESEVQSETEPATEITVPVPESSEPETIPFSETEPRETTAIETSISETSDVPETTGAITEESTAEIATVSASELVGYAVFFTPSGKKMHLDPNCSGLNNAKAVYAASYADASPIRGSFCKICSKSMYSSSGDTLKFTSNPLATAEAISSAFTFDDYLNSQK